MKIICFGRNYAEHAREMGASIPEFPLFFMKSEVSILRPGTPFFYPQFSQEIHYECEVVVKINRVGKKIDAKFAHKYFDEIGLGIDFTARDLQRRCKENGHPWEMAKAFEGSAPISKTFLKKSEIDLNHLNFSLAKNGEIVQRGSTAQMLFSIDKLIEHISQFMTLKKGDLIFTGSPAGVGPVHIGDELRGYIEDREMLAVPIK